MLRILLLRQVLLLVIFQAHEFVAAKIYHVTDTGQRQTDSGFSTKVKMYSLSGALGKAKAGDTVTLADGTYSTRVDSQAHGKKGSPILVTGGKDAIIKADSPAVRVQHNWITLEGFTVDGKSGSSSDIDSYVNKCVEVESTGKSEKDPLEGFVMTDMVIKNCGTECVRLKNFVAEAEITDNTIKNCGVYDFEFDQGEQNGEGIYIGTSSSQWLHGADTSNGNLIIGNTIATHGSECVDIKEGSYGNIVEYNTCSYEMEEKSGCMNVRGDTNIIRYNTVKDCSGVGIRLGGSEVSGLQYGLDNDVYENTILRADAGAIKVMAIPQGDVCDNECRAGDCTVKGEYGSYYKQDWNESC